MAFSKVLSYAIGLVYPLIRQALKARMIKKQIVYFFYEKVI
jgi:hypothetical protein